MTGIGSAIVVANLVIKIAEAVERVKNNKRRLLQLTKRIKVLAKMTTDIEQSLDPKVIELVEHFGEVLTEIHDLLSRVIPRAGSNVC